jgi:hypothetical protein
LSRHDIEVLFAGLVAAVAYCSWPLGYLLNATVAGTALASDLEARGQPFSWLFILLDCVTGAATLAVAWLAWPTRGAETVRLSRFVLLSYAAFGLTTAIDALIPLGCGSAPLNRCSADLSHLTIDDYLTAVAVLALFVAAVGTEVLSARAQHLNLYFVGAVLLTAVWAVCGLVFFALHFSTNPEVPMQHLMLTLTSASALMVPIGFITASHLTRSLR